MEVCIWLLLLKVPPSPQRLGLQPSGGLKNTSRCFHPIGLVKKALNTVIWSLLVWLHFYLVLIVVTPPSSVDFHGMLIFYDGQRIIVLDTKACIFVLSPDANISILGTRFRRIISFLVPVEV